MALVCLSNLFQFTIPSGTLSHLQSFYSEDVCLATVEMLARFLHETLEMLPRLPGEAGSSQVYIACYPLTTLNGGFSVLVSIGAPNREELDEELQNCMNDFREHWIRWAWNLKAGGAERTVQNLRRPLNRRPEHSILEDVSVRTLNNHFRRHY